MAHSSGNHSDDDVIPGEKMKLEKDDSWPSSSAQEKSIRSSQNLLFKVKFSGKTKDCQTNGQETIKDMLIRYHPKLPKERAFKNMIFKRIRNDCAINLGLPTGALSDEEYECVIRTKSDGGESDFANMRQYNVKNYRKDWDMGCFFIKFDKKRNFQPSVGDIRTEVDMVQIDFFQEESLYGAIVRDKRLQIKNDKGQLVVAKWYFKLDDSEVSLSNDAKLYKENSFKLYQKRQADTKLPESVPELLEPNLAGAKIYCLKENDTVKPESNSNASLVAMSTNFDIQASSSGSNSQGIKFTCDTDFEDFLKRHFNVEVQKQAEQKIEKKRISSIKRFFSQHYNNFALTKGNVRSASKWKDLTMIFDSVGAVVVELDSGKEFSIGTCFVIGSEYVITNRHVFDMTLNHVGFKDFYVDFEYKHGCHGYKFRFSKTPVISSDADFANDYAILQLRESDKELPPSLAKCGYVIPSIDDNINAGTWLTLVGYPQGADGKVVEDACPIENPSSLHKDVVLSLSLYDHATLKDLRRRTYHTGAFFHGSSGSPGVLMNEKLLVVLHCRGFCLQDNEGSIIEQGVKMTAIKNEVDIKIKYGILKGFTLNELFDIPLNPKEEPMAIDLDAGQSI